jgi:hypothetical protein
MNGAAWWVCRGRSLLNFEQADLLLRSVERSILVLGIVHCKSGLPSDYLRRDAYGQGAWAAVRELDIIILMPKSRRAANLTISKSV